MPSRALLCGINDYKSVSDLRGCLNDVENMKALLIGKFGFRADEIHVLTDKQVVKKNVEKEWAWLLKGGGAGDTLVFHFSGHGSYLPDANGDDDDGRDELMCLWDMDFDDPNTYLLDDTVAAWTKKKPAGANLVVVTDCCHSGTNTRLVLREVRGEEMLSAVDLEATARLASRDGTNPNDVQVLSRFLPPPNYQRSMELNFRTTRRSTKKRDAYNHLHLAACTDFETAADAYIEGSPNGAFTFHLCRALVDEPRLSSTDLVGRLAGPLQPYSQQPQENGGPKAGPIFGVNAGGSTPAPSAPSRDGGVSDATAHELIVAVRELTAALKQSPRGTTRSRSTGRRVLVYVHGISEHPGDYSLPWWQAVQPHVGNTYGNGDLNDTRFGVHWSDIVNPRSLDRAMNDEAAALLRQMIEAEIAERTAVPNGPVGGRSLPVIQARGGGPQLDDFIRYMLVPRVRTQVLARFTDVVRPLLAAGDTVDIVSHSWGTVVAYEGLLQLDAEGLPGRVANLFTAGAALSIGAVRWRLGLRNRRPAMVGTWVNVDAEGDGVGGKLAGHFPIDGEFLNTHPTGCTRGWLGYDLTCAHLSYFRADNVAVNRDIFAAYILPGG